MKALPDDLKAAEGHVPWASIAGMRNVVVHEYFRVDPVLIGDILTSHLPQLAAVIEERK